MGIWNRLYNRLAQTNLGNLLGLLWNPESDEDYQLERLQARIEDWSEMLGRSEQALSKGDFQFAGNMAYWVTYEMPSVDDPVVLQLRKRAETVIRQMPPDYRAPPNYKAPIQPRMSARDARAKLDQAKRFFDAGKTDEANQLVTDVQDHQVYSVWDSHAVDATLLASQLRMEINARLLAGKKPLQTNRGFVFVSNDVTDPVELEELRKMVDEEYERQDRDKSS